MKQAVENIKILRKEIPKKATIILEYEGIFSQEKIKELSIFLKKQTEKQPVVQRKMFYIFIELAQNVSYYSAIKSSNEIGKGSVIFYETKEKIGFIIGNAISPESYKILSRKAKIINSLDRQTLRELKRYQRNIIPGTNGGAHIGMIMVALTTNEPLNIKYTEIDENLFFFFIDVSLRKNL